MLKKQPWKINSIGTVTDKGCKMQNMQKYFRKCFKLRFSYLTSTEGDL
jgi:hypothetical protein